MAGHGSTVSIRPVRDNRGARRIYWLRSRKLSTRRPVHDIKCKAALTCSGRLKVLPKSKLKSKAISLRHSQNVKEINEAFSLLSDILPPDINGVNGPNPTDNQQGTQNNSVSMNKITRVTTLRQATSYIRALSELLNNTHLSDDSANIESDGNNNSNVTNTSNNSNKNSCNENDKNIVVKESTNVINRTSSIVSKLDEKDKTNCSDSNNFKHPHKKFKISCNSSNEIKR